MSIGFCKRADEIAGFIIAICAVGMAGSFFPPADQRVLKFITGFRMNVAAVGKARRRVDMFADFRQRTDQIAGTVVTGNVMVMNDEVRLPADQVSFCVVAILGMLVQHGGCQAGQLRFKDRRLQGITALVVDMLLQPAHRLRLHGDGRKNQRVGCDKNNDAGQHTYDSLPDAPAAKLSGICFLGKRVLPHGDIPPFRRMQEKEI